MMVVLNDQVQIFRTISFHETAWASSSTSTGKGIFTTSDCRHTDALKDTCTIYLDTTPFIHMDVPANLCSQIALPERGKRCLPYFTLTVHPNTFIKLFQEHFTGVPCAGLFWLTIFQIPVGTFHVTYAMSFVLIFRDVPQILFSPVSTLDSQFCNACCSISIMLWFGFYLFLSSILVKKSWQTTSSKQ